MFFLSQISVTLNQSQGHIAKNRDVFHHGELNQPCSEKSECTPMLTCFDAVSKTAVISLV